jgi:hypothetical protein
MKYNEFLVDMGLETICHHCNGNENGCGECNGHGWVPTELGKAIILLIKRWINIK